MAPPEDTGARPARMQLFWSSRSPYARKVMVCAHELGIADRLEPTRVVVGIVRLNDTVMARNPLNKIPTLVLPGGEALFDSRVICEYLDASTGAPRLFPSGAARWPALRMQALADGLMDLLTLRLFEEFRPEALRWQDVHRAARTKIDAACDAAERMVAPDGPFHIGRIAMACAIGHLDFRFGPEGWRDRRPALAAWYDAAAARPSLAATEYENVY